MSERVLVQIPHEQIMMYRDTLLRTSETREVLKDILNDLYYFHGLENDEQRILHNAAIKLLAKLGVALPSQMDARVEAFRNILPPPPKEPNDNGR
jgi:hypothetical protein